MSLFARLIVASLASLGMASWCLPTAQAQTRPKKRQGATTSSSATSPEALQQAITLYNQGKYAEAERLLRGMQGPDASAYLSVSLARQQKFAEAEAPANSALAADPVHAVAAEGLGQSLVGQKKYDDAVNRLSGVLAAKNDVAYAYYWRGMAYYNKRQPDRMVGDFEAFLRLAPQAPEAATVRQLLATFK